MGVSVRLSKGKVIADPFPVSNNPNLAVVTSVPIGQGNLGGQIQRRGFAHRGVRGGGVALPSPSKSALSVLGGSSSTRKKTQAPTLTRRKQKQRDLDRLCKIVVNKKTGKRKRVCREKTPSVTKKKKRKRQTGIADNVARIPSSPKFARFNFV